MILQFLFSFGPLSKVHTCLSLPLKCFTDYSTQCIHILERRQENKKYCPCTPVVNLPQYNV